MTEPLETKVEVETTETPPTQSSKLEERLPYIVGIVGLMVISLMAFVVFNKPEIDLTVFDQMTDRWTETAMGEYIESVLVVDMDKEEPISLSGNTIYPYMGYVQTTKAFDSLPIEKKYEFIVSLKQTTTKNTMVKYENNVFFDIKEVLITSKYNEDMFLYSHYHNEGQHMYKSEKGYHMMDTFNTY